jgi:hypothetical protein
VEVRAGLRDACLAMLGGIVAEMTSIVGAST